MGKIADSILAAVKAAAPEGKISCKDAQALAEKLDVSYAVIGKAANELNIRIKSCQFGCF